MTMTFNDKDPEDVWDDGDPLPFRIALLADIIDHIAMNRGETRFAGRRSTALRLLIKLEGEISSHGNELRRLRDLIETL